MFDTLPAAERQRPHAGRRPHPAVIKQGLCHRSKAAGGCRESGKRKAERYRTCRMSTGECRLHGQRPSIILGTCQVFDVTGPVRPGCSANGAAGVCRQAGGIIHSSLPVICRGATLGRTLLMPKAAVTDRNSQPKPRSTGHWPHVTGAPINA